MGAGRASGTIAGLEAVRMRFERWRQTRSQGERIWESLWAAAVKLAEIHTCELCGADPFQYLTELDRHAQEVAARLQDSMPWKYQSALTANTAPCMAKP